MRHPGGQGEGHFLARLADPRINDLLQRHAGSKRAANFAFRNHIRAGAKPCQSGDDGQISVRLNGIGNQRVTPGKGIGYDPVMAADSSGRITIARGA